MLYNRGPNAAVLAVLSGFHCTIVTACKLDQTQLQRCTVPKYSGKSTTPCLSQSTVAAAAVALAVERQGTGSLGNSGLYASGQPVSGTIPSLSARPSVDHTRPPVFEDDLEAARRIRAAQRLEPDIGDMPSGRSSERSPPHRAPTRWGTWVWGARCHVRSCHVSA